MLSHTDSGLVNYIMYPFMLCTMQALLPLVSWANVPITLSLSLSISRLSFLASRIKRHPCVLNRYTVISFGCSWYIASLVATCELVLCACDIMLCGVGKPVPKTSNPRKLHKAKVQETISLSVLEVCGWRSSSPAAWCHHFPCELMLLIVTYNSNLGQPLMMSNSLTGCEGCRCNG